MNVVETIAGHYQGTGTWYDSQGKTMNYTVTQKNELIADGFAVEFKHDFDDGSHTEARFEMHSVASHIFQVTVGRNPMGNAYCIANACKYYIKAGEAFVEVGYHPTADGLEVYGSSTKNADGNYIAWHESLRRIK